MPFAFAVRFFLLRLMAAAHMPLAVILKNDLLGQSDSL